MSQAAAIESNYDVLLRCTTINCYVIDCLKAEDVIDRIQEAKLRTKRNSITQCDLLFKWLKGVSSKKYESFLEVMNDTEQEHVANLLSGSTEDANLPLSDVRHRRLDKIRPKIAHVISIDIEMIAELRKFRAISRTDAEDIRAEKTEYAQISKLISAIMRRSNYCYHSLTEILKNTRQKAAAAYLSDGEMLAVHVNNNRPDMDGILSSTFNEVIKNNSDVDSCIKEQLTEMSGIGLNLVRAIPGQSIVIFIYCKTVQNGVTFTQLFNSGRLLQNLDAILNRLLLKFEPHNTEELDSRISLGEEEIDALEEFTGIKDWMRKRSNVPKPVGKINGCDAATQTTEAHFTMNKTEMGRCCCCGRGWIIDITDTAPGHVFDCQHFLGKERLENLSETRLQSICSLCRTPSVIDRDGSSVDKKPNKDSGSVEVVITTTSIVDDGSMKKTLEDALIYESNPPRIGSRLRMIGDDGSDIPATRKQLGINEFGAQRFLKIPTNTWVADLTKALHQRKKKLEAAEKDFEEQGIMTRNRIKKHAQMSRELVERDEKHLLQRLDETINETMGDNWAAIRSCCNLIQWLEKAEQKGEAGTAELEQLMTRRINTTQFKNFNLSLNDISVPVERNVVGELKIEPIQDHSSFLTTPVLIGSIPADDRHQAVTGVTAIDREIFITHDGSTDISVYSVMTNTYLRSLSLLNLLKTTTVVVPSPADLAACRYTRTLYVADKSNECVYRLSPDGKLIHWWTVHNLRGLSVTPNGTVLVGSGRTIQEYSQNGKLIREIYTSVIWSFFQDWERPSIKRPMHFLETEKGRIVVCDFPTSDASLGGLHVIYYVYRKENAIARWHGNRADSGDEFLNEPSHLAIDDTGHVMVADRLNDRVKLLNSELKFVRDLIGPDQWIKSPQRLHCDRERGLLYVGLVAGDTLVFKVTL